MDSQKSPRSSFVYDCYLQQTYVPSVIQTLRLVESLVARVNENKREKDQETQRVEALFNVASQIKPKLKVWMKVALIFTLLGINSFSGAIFHKVAVCVHIF